MSGRKITYDEIQLEILARQDLSPEDRTEVLLFIRSFKQELSDRVVQEFIPKHLHSKLNVRVV